MKRRTVLHAAAAGVVTMSGCAAMGSHPPESTNDLERFDPTTRDDRGDVDNPVVEQNGDYEPHHVSVWNATDEPRQISLEITDRSNQRGLFEMTETVPVDVALKVTLPDRSTYTIELRVPVLDAQQTLRVPSQRFDCNESTTQIGVFSSGEIRSTILTTSLRC
ncbi:hypothetical protein [Halobaculum roseum]|uniref:Uncharacterized protein n=1 Tax=Halobaculum roseum TaxID=2175149 RepID=A0ABD5MS78_9EURY|nr:hypothetical protein [Halobaculum roseum]QZY03772.1 hypothetical protein K6T36_06315 [Halobaculum roseum]